LGQQGAEGAHLILGGARSGKTAYALAEARRTGLEKWMIATAEAADIEMKDRIARHKAERGAGWRVVEEKSELVDVLRKVARSGRVAVVDCLTMWLSNLFMAQRDVAEEVFKLASCLDSLDGPVIFVANEIGLGLVPEGRLGRVFRDAQGELNQAMAQACESVTFVVAGVPWPLKRAEGRSR